METTYYIHGVRHKMNGQEGEDIPTALKIDDRSDRDPLISCENKG